MEANYVCLCSRNVRFAFAHSLCSAHLFHTNSFLSTNWYWYYGFCAHCLEQATAMCDLVKKKHIRTVASHLIDIVHRTRL
jgi:hypothetical protein